MVFVSTVNKLCHIKQQKGDLYEIIQCNLVNVVHAHIGCTCFFL